MSLTPVILVPAMLPCYVLMARQMKIVPNRAKPAKPYQTVPAGWWQQHYQQQRYARFVFSVSLFCTLPSAPSPFLSSFRPLTSPVALRSAVGAPYSVTGRPPLTCMCLSSQHPAPFQRQTPHTEQRTFRAFSWRGLTPGIAVGIKVALLRS